jgi:hypothetical protein
VQQAATEREYIKEEERDEELQEEGDNTKQYISRIQTSTRPYRLGKN